MHPKVSVYIATSLDGFIARKNGDIDWLDYDYSPDGGEKEEDYGYQEFFDSVDVLVMGRKSYEKVLTFDEWPYEDKRVIVLSTGNPPVPEHLLDKVTVLSSTPQYLIERLSEEGAKHVYLDGGNTIQRFIAAGLVDEITITRIPILLGEGIPLFGSLDRDVRLEHIGTQSFDNGFVQSRYRFQTG